ncbi:MAG: hypothetical protein HYU69_12775 [Bacteroidetes bacterium]|nr:hypothetical protein [Bacteroidota bacterium]
MNRSVIIAAFCLAAVSLMSFENIYHSLLYSSGAPAGYCGDPRGGGQYCTNCHSGSTTYPTTGWITSNIPAAGYVPGKTYSITATASRFGHSKFGFEISPQNLTGSPLGAIIITDTLTQLTGWLNEYITHKYTGTNGNDSVKWKFDWTAPPAKSGSVIFYGAFNITNNNFSTSGDTIATSTLTVPENINTTTPAIPLDGPKVSAFPIPAADVINISYTLKTDIVVEIHLIDIQGKTSMILPPELCSAGEHVRSFNIKDKYADGVYFIKGSIGQYVFLNKIIIIQ